MAERAPIFDYSLARDGASSPVPENQLSDTGQVVEESSKSKEKPARSKTKARPSVKRGRKLRVARPAGRAVGSADEVPEDQGSPSEQPFENASRSVSERPLEVSFGQPDSVDDGASSDDGQASADNDFDAAPDVAAKRSAMRASSRKRKPVVRRLGAKRASDEDAPERTSAERAARKEAILKRLDEVMLDGGFEPVEHAAESKAAPKRHDRQGPVVPDADAWVGRGRYGARAFQLVSSKSRAVRDKASSLAKGGVDAPSKSAGDLATSITEGILKLATAVVEFAKKPHSKRFNRGVAIAVALVVAIAFIYPSAKDYYVAIRDNAKSEAEYAALQEYYEQLKEDVEILGTDQGIEDAARDEFGMIMPGDVAMNIKDLDSEADFDKNPTEIGITPAGSIKAPEKWYTYILDPFFGYEG